MEDFYNTSLYESYNDSNIEYDFERNMPRRYEDFIDVVLYIIISIGLPLTLVAIYQLYSQVRKDHVAPIYIINLLISDLIQLCCMIVFVAKPQNSIVDGIYAHSLMSSIGFMVCIALERYLVIAWPLWYRFRRNIKTSVVVCVVVWVFILLLIFFISFSFGNHLKAMEIIYAALLLLPLPLFIFSLCGTVKALSAAISVPPAEKRRIVAILVLVLLIYTLLFLPTIIGFLAEASRNRVTFTVLVTFLRFSPLADLFLYVFSRKGAVDRFLACVCCCGMSSDTDIRMNDINL